MNIWIIMIAVMILSWIVSTVLNSRFNKYSKVPTNNGLTGADVARKMLQDNGIYDVSVECIPGRLTDHFDPTRKVINLSEAVYGSASIAAAAVAAHETGHAVQHATGYGPLRMRSALVPVVSFANNTVQWIMLAGVFLLQITNKVLWLGILLFALTTVFSIITLPVEINASARATKWLAGAQITDSRTAPMAKDALKWAAYTYVIAAIGSIGTLLYYISLANNRR